MKIPPCSKERGGICFAWTDSRPGPLPLKRPLKIALVILGAAVAILYLTCVFIAYAATLGIYLDVPVLTPFAVSDWPELLLLPAALFALAVKRKAK